MFQTEPILFLQSFASDGLTAFMSAITWFGYPAAYGAALSIILFGVSFRKGFVLLQMVVWTAILNETAKEIFALPRPYFVDRNVQLLGELKDNSTRFESSGASGFWKTLNPTIIDSYRSLQRDSWGFPSGHSAVFTALWGGFAVLFESVLIRVMLLPMVIAMALSRMYLGRHFLADVVGGIVLGAVVVLLARFILKHSNNWVKGAEHQLAQPNELSSSRPSTLSIASMTPILLLIAPPLLGVLFLPPDGQRMCGLLLGANIGFLALSGSDQQANDHGTCPKALKVVIACSLFFAGAWLMQFLAAHHQIFLLPGVQPLTAMIPSFLLIWGTVTVVKKLDRGLTR